MYRGFTLRHAHTVGKLGFTGQSNNKTLWPFALLHYLRVRKSSEYIVAIVEDKAFYSKRET